MTAKVILIDLTTDPIQETLVDASSIFPQVIVSEEEVYITDYIVSPRPKSPLTVPKVVEETKEEVKEDDTGSVSLHTEEKSEEESMDSEDSMLDFLDDSEETNLRNHDWVSTMPLADSSYDEDDESSTEPPLQRRKFNPAK